MNLWCLFYMCANFYTIKIHIYIRKSDFKTYVFLDSLSFISLLACLRVASVAVVTKQRNAAYDWPICTLTLIGGCRIGGNSAQFRFYVRIHLVNTHKLWRFPRPFLSESRSTASLTFVQGQVNRSSIFILNLMFIVWLIILFVRLSIFRRLEQFCTVLMKSNKKVWNK